MKEKIPNNFENKPNDENAKLYLEALKEWRAVEKTLRKLFKEKDILDIINNMKVYETADKFLKERADKANAPLPDVWLSELAEKYLKLLEKEKDEDIEENEL
jgi:2-phosphoglycerate kinase